MLDSFTIELESGISPCKDMERKFKLGKHRKNEGVVDSCYFTTTGCFTSCTSNIKIVLEIELPSLLLNIAFNFLLQHLTYMTICQCNPDEKFHNFYQQEKTLSRSHVQHVIPAINTLCLVMCIQEARVVTALNGIQLATTLIVQL